MIYVYYGNTQKTIRNARRLARSLLAKKPDASFFVLPSDVFSRAQCDELLSAQSLFGGTYIVYASRVLEHPEYAAYFTERMADVASSPHIFIFAEHTLSPQVYKLVKKHAEKFIEYAPETSASKPRFNMFAFTDAVGARQGLAAWVLYQEGRMQAVGVEDFLTVLIWYLRVLRLAREKGARAKGLERIGIKAYPYRRALSAAARYSSEELAELSHRVMDIFHNARRGTTEAELAFERLLLEPPLAAS